jgi:hypothetical protein
MNCCKLAHPLTWLEVALLKKKVGCNSELFLTSTLGFRTDHSSLGPLYQPSILFSVFDRF